MIFYYHQMFYFYHPGYNIALLPENARGKREIY